MYVKFISAKTIIEAYLRATDEKDTINEEDLMAIVSDTVDRMVDAEVWTYGLVLLEVKGYTTELPSNFRTVDAAAYRLHEHCLTRQEVVTQFREHGLEKDCDLEINLICPKCTQIECNCRSPLVEVDVDKIWAMSHPERFAAHMKHFFGYWNNDAPRGNHDSGFKLMFPNNNNLRDGNYYLGECAEVHYDCEIHYNIDNGMLIVPFKEGQVLVGYKGTQVDADGWRLVPDNSAARQAINYAIEEVMAHKDYRRKKDRPELVYWQNMSAKKELWVGRARNEMNTPSADKWIQTLKNHTTKLLPYWGWEANLGRNQKDRYAPPGATFAHKGSY